MPQTCHWTLSYPVRLAYQDVLFLWKIKKGIQLLKFGHRFYLRMSYLIHIQCRFRIRGQNNEIVALKYLKNEIATFEVMYRMHIIFVSFWVTSFNTTLDLQNKPLNCHFHFFWAITAILTLYCMNYILFGNNFLFSFFFVYEGS